MDIPIPALVSMLAIIVGLLTWQQNRLWKLQDAQSKAISDWMKEHKETSKERLDTLQSSTDKRIDRLERHVDDRFASLTQQVNQVSLQITARRGDAS